MEASASSEDLSKSIFPDDLSEDDFQDQESNEKKSRDPINNITSKQMDLDNVDDDDENIDDDLPPEDKKRKSAAIFGDDSDDNEDNMINKDIPKKKMKINSSERVDVKKYFESEAQESDEENSPSDTRKSKLKSDSNDQEELSDDEDDNNYKLDGFVVDEVSYVSMIFFVIV